MSKEIRAGSQSVYSQSRCDLSSFWNALWTSNSLWSFTIGISPLVFVLYFTEVISTLPYSPCYVSVYTQTPWSRFLCLLWHTQTQTHTSLHTHSHTTHTDLPHLLLSLRLRLLFRLSLSALCFIPVLHIKTTEPLSLFVFFLQRYCCFSYMKPVNWSRGT